jgi:ribosomal protein S18 acetylase RimI-like enzyme
MNASGGTHGMNGAARNVRAATVADLKQVRAQLVAAIDASPFYSARFKSHEKSRFTEAYLRTLLAADPWHVAVATDGGSIAGFVITTPEFGTLWSPWVYIDPASRAKALGVSLIRFMIRHWDNGRFHKIACYVRPENQAALAIFAHFGFAKTALLKAHIFGEDYWLLERPLTRTAADYDSGIRSSRLRSLCLRLGDMFGRAAR